MFSYAALAALALGANPDAPPLEAAAPLLTLEDAVTTAQKGNHLLAGAELEPQKAKERVAALGTRRLPQLTLQAYGGRMLNSPALTIPAGALGTYPGMGSLPAADSTVEVPSEFVGVGMVGLAQPITQQYRIGLGITAAKLDREVATEDVRRARQRLGAEVRTAYYQISATEVGVAALRDLVHALEDLDALTSRHLAEQTVLRGDALEVKARLARERQRLAAVESGLATQREHLNQLLGRDLSTPFRVAPPSELVARGSELSLEDARARARAMRPEVRSASLRQAQAGTALELSHADWIPDLSLVASYTRLENFKVLPKDSTFAGAYLKWEPFDWGRRAHEAAERRLGIEQARQAREETDQQIEVEVGQRWRALRDSAALLEATRLSEEAAQASMETTQNRYREDAKVLNDVLQSEARLSGARHDYTDALAGYWSAAAELERTIGNED